MASFLGKIVRTTIFSTKFRSNNVQFTLISSFKTQIPIKPNLKLPPITRNLTRLQHVNPLLRPQLGIQENISSLQIKKRSQRRKKPTEEEQIRQPGQFSVVAYSTADEYDLEGIVSGLKQQDLYEPKYVENSSDVLYAVAKIPVDNEPREIFIFREGFVIFWNVTDLESGNVLSFLKKYERESYTESMVHEECEIMNYRHREGNGEERSILEKNGDFLLTRSDDILLDKYTFSNAMGLSVKLGMWEASLNKYIDTIEFVTEDLKHGRRIRFSREDVLRKHGELLALRHLINLGSDLLDTPDFYWDNDKLEKLFSEICNYFSISKRTRVMNEKISHCLELVELLSTHLSDKHHIRLEWMIIILIMVEVAFETLHYIDRFYH